MCVDLHLPFILYRALTMSCACIQPHIPRINNTNRMVPGGSKFRAASQPVHTLMDDMLFDIDLEARMHPALFEVHPKHDVSPWCLSFDQESDIRPIISVYDSYICKEYRLQPRVAVSPSAGPALTVRSDTSVRLSYPTAFSANIFAK